MIFGTGTVFTVASGPVNVTYSASANLSIPTMATTTAYRQGWPEAYELTAYEPPHPHPQEHPTHPELGADGTALVGATIVVAACRFSP
jgi:hypothetical protein